MTFKEIYDRIIPLWGKRLDFADGSMIKFDNDNGFYSSKLSQQWTKIEETIGTEEPYSDLMVWTMYQVFNKHASQLFSKSIHHLDPTDISKEEIEEEYYTNLQDDNWKEEFQNYKRVLIKYGLGLTAYRHKRLRTIKCHSILEHDNETLFHTSITNSEPSTSWTSSSRSQRSKQTPYLDK